MTDHTCRAAVLHCMDYRLTGPVHDFLVSLGLDGNYDDVSIAGACKPLVGTDPHKRDMVLEQLQTSCDLHHSQDIYLIHHTDCGAYGGSQAFADDKTERAQHINDMRAAADVIQQKLPQTNLTMVLARMRSDIDIDFAVIPSV